MSNIVQAPISFMPSELMEHALARPPFNPNISKVNRQFLEWNAYALECNLLQILKWCSTGNATLNAYINTLIDRCQVLIQTDRNSETNPNPLNPAIISERDRLISKMYRLIVQKIRNFDIACPNRPLAPQEILRYSAEIAVIEDDNLQASWRPIREAILRAAPGAAPLEIPAENASAETIRVWMNAHQDVLQRVTVLDLSGRGLICLPKEIGLLTGLQKLFLARNNLVELPEGGGILDRLTQLRDIDLSSNRLKWLSIRAFDRLPQLTNLYLDGNPQLGYPFDHEVQYFPRIKCLDF